jgi:hypothetical protein
VAGRKREANLEFELRELEDELANRVKRIGLNLGALLDQFHVDFWLASSVMAFRYLLLRDCGNYTRQQTSLVCGIREWVVMGGPGILIGGNRESPDTMPTQCGIGSSSCGERGARRLTRLNPPSGGDDG